MTKVGDLPYERVDADKLTEKLAAHAKAAAAAGSGEQLARVRAAAQTDIQHFNTMAALSNARFTLNTRDEFYSAEHEYYDEATPAVQSAYVGFMRAFLANPAVKDAETYVNPLVVRQYELAVQCISDETVPLVVEENKLVTEYTKLMAETTYEWEGKQLPLSALKKYFTDADRQVRERAYRVAGTTLESISDRLDGLYDRMVKVRDRIAKALGYDNFVALGDNRMGRISYDRKRIAAFRENVLYSLVPVVARLKTELKEKLGIDTFRLYDNDTYFPAGNPAPVIDAPAMFEAGKEMYRSMSRETGEFFDFMLETDAFDVFPREGKWGGGYCTLSPITASRLS